jgi:hypothetical protein
MMFLAVLIDYHIIGKRLDPKTVEARYQARRELDKWIKWGLAFQGDTLKGKYVKPKIEDWVR